MFYFKIILLKKITLFKAIIDLDSDLSTPLRYRSNVAKVAASTSYLYLTGEMNENDKDGSHCVGRVLIN